MYPCFQCVLSTILLFSHIGSARPSHEETQGDIHSIPISPHDSNNSTIQALGDNDGNATDKSHPSPAKQILGESNANVARAEITNKADIEHEDFKNVTNTLSKSNLTSTANKTNSDSKVHTTLTFGDGDPEAKTVNPVKSTTNGLYETSRTAIVSTSAMSNLQMTHSTDEMPTINRLITKTTPQYNTNKKNREPIADTTIVPTTDVTTNRQPPCDLLKQSRYRRTAVVAAGIGGFVVGGAFVFLLVYLRRRCSRYYNGDYQRVAREYDFELNPRLKTHTF